MSPQCGNDETRKQANCRKQAKARSPHRKQAFIGRVQNLNLTFILIYHAHISLVNVYSNIYLDRYLPKKKYNNYYRRRKQDPRTEIKPIQAEFR